LPREADWVVVGDAGAVAAGAVGAVAAVDAAAEPFALFADVVVAGGVLWTDKGSAGNGAVAVLGATVLWPVAPAEEPVVAGATVAADSVAAGAVDAPLPDDVDAPGISVSVMPDEPVVVAVVVGLVTGASAVVPVVVAAAEAVVVDPVVLGVLGAVEAVVPLAVVPAVDALDWLFEAPAAVEPVAAAVVEGWVVPVVAGSCGVSGGGSSTSVFGSGALPGATSS